MPCTRQLHPVSPGKSKTLVRELIEKPWVTGSEKPFGMRALPGEFGDVVSADSAGIRHFDAGESFHSEIY